MEVKPKLNPNQKRMRKYEIHDKIITRLIWNQYKNEIKSI